MRYSLGKMLCWKFNQKRYGTVLRVITFVGHDSSVDRRSISYCTRAQKTKACRKIYGSVDTVSQYARTYVVLDYNKICHKENNSHKVQQLYKTRGR